MTPEEKAWLVRTLADPTVRAMLERLAPQLAPWRPDSPVAQCQPALS
jgi:hypothetical protein